MSDEGRTEQERGAALAQEPSIDFLILADRAEAVNGKLYMIGGGWDRLTIGDLKKPAHLSIALGVLVPWNATNDPHPVTLRYEDADGRTVQGPIGLTLQVGRPPLAVRGQSFRAMVVVQHDLVLPGPGTYVVVATLANGDEKRTVLYVHAAQARPALVAG